MRRSVRYDEFATALSGSLAAPRDPALAPLVALARQLQTLPLGPTPEFRDTLRARLVAVAAVTTTAPEPAVPWERAREWAAGWRVQRSASAAAAAMAAVVAVAGVSAAGARSLPGDPFYGVKKSTEALELRLARSDVGRGGIHLEHAERRLHEVGDLLGTDIALSSGAADVPLALGGSRGARVAGALRAMDDSTRNGSALLTKAFQDNGETEPLRTLQTFAVRQRAGLAQVLPEIPTGARAEAIDSLALIDEVAQRANALLVNGMCGTTCAPPTPSVASPPAVPQPQAQHSPTPTPDADDLGPLPCSCETAQPEPAPSGSPRPPAPGPSSSPSPQPSSSSTPTPTPTPTPSSYIPVPLPEPVGSTVEDLIREVQDRLPTPLPTLPPLPQLTSPPVPPGLPQGPSGS